MRLFFVINLAVAFALTAQAAAAAAVEDNGQGWSFSGSLNGSSNSSGVVTKLEPVLGYSFNNHVSTYAGVPFYFVNISSSTTTSTTTGAMNGIGNAFLGFRAGVDREAMNYSSTLELTAPTGDKSRGFSTGRVTADWTNRLSIKASSLTPFGSAGIANTVSDTSFFVRPFTSLGLVAHFEGGATYDVASAFRLGASAYAVRGSGWQTVISKIVKRQTATTSGSGSSRGQGNAANGNRVFETQTETVSQADIVNDHGFSTWFAVTPKPLIDLHAGYSRSVNYDFNTFFFGVGFRVGK